MNLRGIKQRLSPFARQRRWPCLTIFLAGTCVALLAVAGWLSNQKSVSATYRPISSEVYVWQRQSSEALDHSLQRLANEPFANAVHVLAAEAHWRGDRLELKTFAQQKVPPALQVGSVLRLGSSMARCGWDDATAADLSKCVATLAATCIEVQIDYDCPQSRLTDYAALLGKLRPHATGKRLCITALPCWLAEPAFKELAALTDDYVLQVHSLHLPENAAQPVALIDPDAARSAALQASALGFPFRLALPTYGCRVYFDTNDNVTEVISEDLGNAPSSSRSQFGYSDPVAIAPLVAEWLQAPPAHLEGLIWFRLPITTDTRNWSFETLTRVARGAPAIDRLQTQCIQRAPGTFDVVITNEGDTDAHLPGTVTLDRSVIFADGTGGYAWQSDGKFLLTQHDWPWLRPQQSATIGWFRTGPAPGAQPSASIAIARAPSFE